MIEPVASMVEHKVRRPYELRRNAGEKSESKSQSMAMNPTQNVAIFHRNEAARS
jgi:hypothetical protein